MAYLYNIADLLLKVPSALVILVLVSLNYIVYNFKYNLDYKIYSFFITLFWIISYVVFFIFFILLIRYYTWGYAFNLYAFLNKIKTMYITNKIQLCILFNFWVLFLLIFIKIRNFCIKQILKLNLYVTGIINQRRKLNYTSSYELFFAKFKNKYSYNSLILERLKWQFIKLLNCYTKYFKQREIKAEIFFYFWNKYLSVFINKLHIIFLLTLLLYDILYNNCIITKVFYYLPFYFIYTLWQQLSNFICNTNFPTNEIIWERYYDEENVLYINTTKMEDNYFLHYMANGFIPISFDFETILVHAEFERFIIINRRFLRDKNNTKGKVYINPNTHETTGDMLKDPGIIKIRTDIIK